MWTWRKKWINRIHFIYGTYFVWNLELYLFRLKLPHSRENKPQASVRPEKCGEDLALLCENSLLNFKPHTCIYVIYIGHYYYYFILLDLMTSLT